MNFGLMMRRALQKSLPYDAELDYLILTGPQYINCGFKANTSTTKLKIRIIPTDLSKTQGVFGSRNATSPGVASCNCFILSGTIRPDWASATSPGNAASTTISIIKDSQYDIEITRGYFKINDSEFFYENSDSVNQSGDFLIGNFSNPTYPFSQGFVGKIGKAMVYENGIPIRDYSPVRVGQVGYFYDKVSDRLFEDKSGVGFILGPDK